MKELLVKIAKYVFYAAFGLVFVFVVGELFFTQQIDQVMDRVSGLFQIQTSKETLKMDTMKIVYPDEPKSFEPTKTDPTVRQTLMNVYEPLVNTDSDMKIKPALAASWGLIDDRTWEFRLRPDVKFHDGSTFEAKDAEASLKRAMKYPDSELKETLSTIDKIEKMDDLVLRITTKVPDPLMLSKLSLVLIIPSEYETREIAVPVGTGSYRFGSWMSGEKIVLERFENYWGGESKFKTVEMYACVDKFERVQMLLDKKADFVAFVPYDGVELVVNSGYEISAVPSLEVQFLIFNMESSLFKNIQNRIMVSQALNQDDLIEAVGGYAKPVSQFVSGGIFGFNPHVSDHVYDAEKAGEIAVETGIKGKTIQFHLLKGLTVLGDYVKEKMGEIGVEVAVLYLDGAGLIKSMEAGEADIYFLGFKSEMGDASNFLETVAKSNGSFNYWRYKNEHVDKLIDAGLVEMDELARRKDLQEAMRVLVTQDVLGVPLFEYETVYAFNDKLDINPRIDGIIRFDELTVKQP